MSFIHPDGRQADSPVGRPTVEMATILETRDREMYVHSLQGWPYRKIALKYRVSYQVVGRRIKGIPEAEKARLRRLDLGSSVA